MNVFEGILGINWKTTIAGIGVIAAAIGRLIIAYRTKDIGAMVTDSQLVMETLMALIVAFGLAKAKDQDVTGAGPSAKSIDDVGVATNREGRLVP